MCLVLDATAPFGDGDRWVAGHLDLPRSVVVVNKIDRATPQQVLGQLAAAGELGAEAYFPVSARTGEGVAALVEHLVARLPEGPAFFPDDTVRDVPEEQWVAELVREQLLAVTRDELPYSIATRVSEWEGNRITVEIIVERESQKGMVIGRGGQVLKQVGQRARAAAPRGDVPGPARQGRQGLAAPARPRRSPVLTERRAQADRRRRRTAAVSTGTSVTGGPRLDEVEQRLVVVAGDRLSRLALQPVAARHAHRLAVEREADLTDARSLGERQHELADGAALVRRVDPLEGSSPARSTVTKPVPDSTTELTRSSGSSERSPMPTSPGGGPSRRAGHDPQRRRRRRAAGEVDRDTSVRRAPSTKYSSTGSVAIVVDVA